MKGRFACVFLVAAALGAGCDGKAPKVASVVTPAPSTSAREEAALLASRGDYAGAERKYREALQAQPDDVELHFGLGSVLSQLDRRQDAIEEFRWVVANGRAGRPEVDSARRWLAEAQPGEAVSTEQASATAPEATGQLAGKLTWPGLPADKTFGIRIVLERDGETGARKIVRTKLNATYSVDGLSDGRYKLTGLAGPVRVWNELPVTVSAGRATTVDLTPANASVSPAEFPAR